MKEAKIDTLDLIRFNEENEDMSPYQREYYAIADKDKAINTIVFQTYTMIQFNFDESLIHQTVQYWKWNAHHIANDDDFYNILTQVTHPTSENKPEFDLTTIKRFLNMMRAAQAGDEESVSSIAEKLRETSRKTLACSMSYVHMRSLMIDTKYEDEIDDYEAMDLLENVFDD